MNYRSIIQHRLFPVLSVGTAALAAGAAGGYYFGRQYAIKYFRKKLDTTVETIVTVKEETQLVLSFDAEEYVNVIPIINRETREESVLAETNVFVDVIEGWDYETELANRSPEFPYVIHRDEFYGDEMGWDNQSSLTWYAQDSILCMEDDTVVYNPDVMVGELKFGHGSGDPEVVFIRNEKLHAEYEIFRNPGSFETEVLGQFEEQMRADDLKHSRAPGKFPRQE